MNNKFTKDDLLPGYVVKLGNGQYRVVTGVGKLGTYVLIGADGDWEYLSHWNNNLNANEYILVNPHKKQGREFLKSFDIVEVYGFVTNSQYYNFANQISCIGRDLLWTRTPTVKMTVSEIEEKLGHKVEIIAEE